MTCINIEQGDIPSYLATTLEESLPVKLLICYLTEQEFTGFVLTLHLHYCSGSKGALDCPSEGDQTFLKVLERSSDEWIVIHSPPVLGKPWLRWSSEVHLNFMCQRVLEQVCDPQNSSRCCVSGACARPSNGPVRGHICHILECEWVNAGLWWEALWGSQFTIWVRLL